MIGGLEGSVKNTKGWTPNLESSPLTLFSLSVSIADDGVSHRPNYCCSILPTSFCPWFGPRRLHQSCRYILHRYFLGIRSPLRGLRYREPRAVSHLFLELYISSSFCVTVILGLSDNYLLSVHYIHSLWQSLQTATAAHHLSVHVENALYAALI